MRPRRRQRKHCDARVKNPVKRKNGVAIYSWPRCRAWAMPNGRCRVHGGASTGPKSAEGKARVVAAMVEGRCKWVERRRAEGRRFSAGRQGGDAWVTEAMRERARAEAHGLGGGRFTLDRPLVLALLKGAKGEPQDRARAKAMLDAQERAAIDRDRGRALSVVRDLRARAIAGWSGRAPVPTPLPFAEVGPNAYAPRLTRRPDRGRPDHSCRQVAAESLPGARPPRGNNDGESPAPQFAGQASRRRSRW